MTTDGHLKTPLCGFDRQASHSTGRYVCACGYEEAANEPINAGAPNNLTAMERRITELTENGARLLEAADGWKASAQYFHREKHDLEVQLERQIVQNNSDAARFRECVAENTALREEVMALYESMGRTR